MSRNGDKRRAARARHWSYLWKTGKRGECWVSIAEATVGWTGEIWRRARELGGVSAQEIISDAERQFRQCGDIGTLGETALKVLRLEYSKAMGITYNPSPAQAQREATP